MKRAAWLWSACALGVCGTVLLGAGPAAAQECVDDSDCGDGLVCKSYGTIDCPTARDAMDCPPGAECVQPEPAPADDCVPQEYKQCELPPCSDDSDCPDGTVCHSDTYTECSGGAGVMTPQCEPGADCPEPDPVPPEQMEECHDVTTPPQCVPRYVLPCEVAADCGAGFTCEEYVSVSCSGSSGGSMRPSPGSGDFAPPQDAGVDTDPVPPEESCTEEPTGEHYCAPIEVTCGDDADCEDGWTCEANPEVPVCSTPDLPPMMSGDDGAAGSAGDLPAADTDCGVSSDTPEKVCQPPFYAQGGGFGIARGEALDTNASGNPAGDPGAAPVPQEPGSDGDDNAPSGTSHGTGEEAEESMTGEDNSSCAVTAPGTGNALAGLLPLLGLALLAVRRRRNG